uniref:Irregular chiasm C-roughest protein n=1 Tax=Timema bartmani TaxID=61472 RepID=A0A7R9ET08_9NEOP|nr:unnamed protein product [Timema bartmani]
MFETGMEPRLRALVLLALLVTRVSAGEQRFAMEPQDQTAIVGSRVTLPCRVINKTGVLQWTKDDFGLGTHRNLSGFDRYSMIGSDEEGRIRTNHRHRSILSSLVRGAVLSKSDAVTMSPEGRGVMKGGEEARVNIVFLAILKELPRR